MVVLAATRGIELWASKIKSSTGEELMLMNLSNTLSTLRPEVAKILHPRVLKVVSLLRFRLLLFMNGREY